jgi:hypothetical protein
MMDSCKEAKALLLEEEWSLVVKLPMRWLSQLCELLGLECKWTKSVQLEVIKEWREWKLRKREEWLEEGHVEGLQVGAEPGWAAAASSSSSSSAVSPGGAAHDGSVSAARTSKWRRSSMDITDEEEGEGEDNLGSLLLFDDYDQEVCTGEWWLLWELGCME